MCACVHMRACECMHLYAKECVCECECECVNVCTAFLFLHFISAFLRLRVCAYVRACVRVRVRSSVRCIFYFNFVMRARVRACDR